MAAVKKDWFSIKLHPCDPDLLWRILGQLPAPSCAVRWTSSRNRGWIERALSWLRCVLAQPWAQRFCSCGSNWRSAEADVSTKCSRRRAELWDWRWTARRQHATPITVSAWKLAEACASRNHLQTH